MVAGNRKHDSWLQLAKFVNVTLIAWVTNRRSHWSLQSINCHSYRLYCIIRKLIIAIKRYIVETLSKRNTLCGNTNSRQITWKHFYQRKYETRVIVAKMCRTTATQPFRMRRYITRYRLVEAKMRNTCISASLMPYRPYKFCYIAFMFSLNYSMAFRMESHRSPASMVNKKKEWKWSPQAIKYIWIDDCSLKLPIIFVNKSRVSCFASNRMHQKCHSCTQNINLDFCYQPHNNDDHYECCLISPQTVGSGITRPFVCTI